MAFPLISLPFYQSPLNLVYSSIDANKPFPCAFPSRKLPWKSPFLVMRIPFWSGIHESALVDPL